MDKITRIHIAKIPYEIGVEAESKLNKYLEAIKRQLEDDLADEIMQDIEVRVTEILAERGTKEGGVITVKDIDAIKDQLGAPEQFNDELSDDEGEVKKTKRLLRDMDGSYIGGVASGLAVYFNIDPIFIRLIFVALTFLSGLGIVLYLLLWLLVPPAKSSSEKLQMQGKSVTAAALQRYRGTAHSTIANPGLRAFIRIILKIVRIGVTGYLILVILALLTGAGFGTSILFSQPLHPLYSAYHLNFLLFVLFWTLAASIVGLLVVFILWMWRVRGASIKIALISLLSILVLSVAGSAITAPFVVTHYKNKYGNNQLVYSLPISQVGAVVPSSIDVQSDGNLQVSYNVSSGPMRATYQSYPGMGSPDIKLLNSDGVLSITSSNLNKVAPNCVLDWCHAIYLPVKLNVYGPAMNSYSVSYGASLYVSGVNSKTVSLYAYNTSTLNLNNSFADTINILTQNRAVVDGSSSSATNLNVTPEDSSYINAPISYNFSANVPAQCNDTLIELSQDPAAVVINGTPTSINSVNNDSCLSLDNFNGPDSVQVTPVNSVPVPDKPYRP